VPEAFEQGQQRTDQGHSESVALAGVRRRINRHFHGLQAHRSLHTSELPPGPNHVPLLMLAILAKRLTFRGFIVLDYASQFPEFIAEMKGWLSEGRVKYREDITDGLERAARADWPVER
jgi:hypothetical protein